MSILMDSLNSLLTLYQDKLISECRKYYRNQADAWDLYQEAALKMTAAFASFDQDRSFLPWARVIIKRCYIDQLRALKDDLEEQAYASQIDSYHVPEQKHLRDAAIVLNRMKEFDSFLIQEVCVNKVSQRKLAKSLGMSQQAISKRLRFKEMYDEYTERPS
jgi:RNA polymerase sigma factor (sigma-70 family)